MTPNLNTTENILFQRALSVITKAQPIKKPPLNQGGLVKQSEGIYSLLC